MKKTYSILFIIVTCLSFTISASAQSFGDRMADGMSRKTYDIFDNAYNRYRGVDEAGSSYLSLGAGLSRMYGEYVRLHANMGGKVGFTLYGGVGKDWLFKSENWEKLLWHAGVGMYIYEDWNDSHFNASQFDFGITYSENALISGGVLSADLGFVFFPGFAYNRIGFRAAGGCGLAFDGGSHFYWEYSIGIRVKLFTNGSTKPKIKKTHSIYDY